MQTFLISKCRSLNTFKLPNDQNIKVQKLIHIFLRMLLTIIICSNKQFIRINIIVVKSLLFTLKAVSFSLYRSSFIIRTMLAVFSVRARELIKVGLCTNLKFLQMI